MENFELVALENGIFSLKSSLNNETFHPAIGPQAEAEILHVKQQNIVELSRSNADFVLWDVGLGAAANALTALEAILNDPFRAPGNRFTLESFDKTTGPLEFALQNSQSLKYPKAYEALLKNLLENGSVNVNDSIVWNFHLGDFCQKVESLSLRAPDAIFYDPYSARGNAEMWTEDHFTKLFSKLSPGRQCLLTNYTSSTYIRVTLLLAGFFVGKGVAVNKRLHTTVASNRLEALQEPLDKDWLMRRLPISHSAAPIRDLPYKIAPIAKEDYERLLKHPQFL